MKVFNSYFMNALDALVFSCPYISCDSWGRSELHNRAVSPGAPMSQHTFWNAVDLTADSTDKLILVAAKALELGFRGIELDYRNNHLHIDWREAFWRVAYTKDGRQHPLEFFITNGGNHGSQV